MIGWQKEAERIQTEPIQAETIGIRETEVLEIKALGIKVPGIKGLGIKVSAEDLPSERQTAEIPGTDIVDRQTEEEKEGSAQA